MVTKAIKGILIMLLLSWSAVMNAQSNNVRGYYLKDVNSWLGNTTQENTILNYSQGNGFTYIIFYDLGSFDWSSTTKKNQLAAFMTKARNTYGITEISASGEIYTFFSNYIIPYNNSRTVATEKFNVLNFEFEYWVSSSISSLYCSKYLVPNGCSCDTAGAWAFSWREFKKIDSLAGANGLVSEYYLGWPNKGQIQQVASRSDRILLHAYRTNDADVYQYSRNRLIDAASLNTSVKIIPIFSSESSFMGPWLASHPVTQPYQTYSGYYTSETGTWKSNINLQGYVWFTYSTMPQTTTAAVATITAGGPTSFCTGGSVTLTANSGSQYLWSPGGATTRSITVSTSGSYTVRVTNTSGVNATSPATVVTVSSTMAAPTITASGPTSFCAGGNVTLTSSTAGAYLWSNSATTQSITVSTAGSYTVRATTGGCTATSTATAVSITTTAATPTITASGSLNICPGKPITLTSSAASGYLWSNGATTRSIVISSAGTYWVKGYGGPNCFAQSANKVTSLLTAPATPTITASGSTTLSTSNPSITLTASTASTYSWLSGQSTRSITVNAQGSYRVTVTGSNGCAATSSAVLVNANGCTPPAVPTITLSGSNVLVSGQTVTLTSSTAGGYLWSTGATTKSITVSAAGTYSVRAYNAGSCYSTSLTTTVYVISARQAQTVDNTTSSEFTAFPNPAQDHLAFSFNAGADQKIEFRMVDMSGRIMEERNITAAEGENRIDLEIGDYARGIYLATLRTENEQKLLKIVVQ